MPSSFCMLYKMLEYRKFLFTYVLDKQFILGTVFPSRQKIKSACLVMDYISG